MFSGQIRIPKTLIWVINLLGIFILIFTLFRLITFFSFRPSGIDFSNAGPAFWLGLRYDLRWIAIVLLPIVLLSSMPTLSPFYSERNKKFWTLYLAVLTLLIFFFFAP